MEFSTFSTFLQRIEQTTKRLEMTHILAELFAHLKGKEIQQACYLMQGRVVPAYIPKEFQLSTKMLIRVLATFIPEEINGDVSPVEKLTTRYKQVGDIGTFAEEVITTVENKTQNQVDIQTVFATLVEITETQGQGSQAKKVELTQELFSQLDPLSVRYVARIVAGNMRLGFSDMTMIDALSWTIKGDKSLSSQIEDAYQKQADIGVIAQTLLEKGIEALTNITVKVGTPVIPALCQRLNTAQEIIEKMGKVYAEPKYDGTRVQIHCQKGSRGQEIVNSKQEDTTNYQLPTTNYQIRTFTRNLEESSHMFPELQEIGKYLHCDSCILDSEAIGYDPETGNLLPFQQTIQRKRKHGVEEIAQSIPLRFFIFDVLAVDGESYIDKPLIERKQRLTQLVQPSKTFVQASYLETDDVQTLREYHEEQLAQGLEGVVIKKVDAPYQSGRKGFSWVKIKEAEGVRGKLSDTVDGIVMGYFYGTGKRTQFGMGAVLVGVLNPEGEVVSISKVGSGFTEASTQEFIQRAQPFIKATQPKMYQVHKLLLPDVWLDPGIVIEIAADEITKSPSHTSGVALRFPRIIRFRDDKTWQQATSVEEITQMVSLPDITKTNSKL